MNNSDLPIAETPRLTEGKWGRLKVYLGMAAGVGKTYSMLSDGKAQAERGVDTVVGYLEPHGRIETERIADGLEMVVPKVTDHRGVAVKEFDLDASLARNPELILVDELAHHNLEGSRHAKRWQDIEELLQHRIDVFTTVNIQHVASLRDVVAQITGVFVQETVPDSFFEMADEIELVDLPPEELQKRLADGKVYRSEKVQQALSGFFKRGNLLALRELSLRHVAERVDEQMRQQRGTHSSDDPWHASERILACVSPGPSGAKVVRSARRLATGLHAELTVISVDSSRQAGVSEKGRAQLREVLDLAESLGAKTVTLAGDDIAAEVVRYAQAGNFTTILIGKPPRNRWRQAVMGSLVDEIIRTSGAIDVLVVNEVETAKPDNGSKVERTVPFRSEGYIEAVGVTLVSVAAGLLLKPVLEETNIAMLFLLGISLVAFRHGRRPSLFAAVLGILTFDIVFVPPQGSFEVADAQYLVTFLVMLVVSLTISTLAQRQRNQAKSTSERERSTAILYEVSRHLAATRKKEEMAKFAALKLKEVTKSEVAVSVYTGSGEPDFLVHSPTQFEMIPKEMATLRWVLDNHRLAGRSTDTLSGAQGLYLPLMADTICLGAVGIALPRADALDFSQSHLVEAIVAQLASSLERVKLARESTQALVRVESERSRNNLLSAVSHDLRTPLAAIQGSAGLIAANPEVPDAVRTLGQTIESEAERMSRLVRNLLDMTRVQGGDVPLDLDWYSLEELAETSVRRTQGQFDNPVEFDFGANLPLVQIDGILFEQVLVNLLENASRYAGRESQVKITVRSQVKTVVVDVFNTGSSVPEGQLAKIFENFQRGGQEGFGLGLAICRAIVKAHRGRIWAENRGPAGIVFRIELPVAPTPPQA